MYIFRGWLKWLLVTNGWDKPSFHTAKKQPSSQVRGIVADEGLDSSHQTPGDNLARQPNTRSNLDILVRGRLIVVDLGGRRTRMSRILDGISRRKMPRDKSWFPTLISLVVIPRSSVMLEVKALPILARSNWSAKNPNMSSGIRMKSILLMTKTSVSAKYR